MEKNRILVPLSKELVSLIDRNRDDLSRYEFIELCIDGYFEDIIEEREEESEGQSEMYEGVRIPVSLPEGLVLLIDENRDDLSRNKFIDLCMKRYCESTKKNIRPAEMDLPETDRFFWSEKKEIREEVPWKSKFTGLWFGAFLSYGAGDVFSSYLAYGNAWVSEGNPVLRYLLGDNIYAFIPFKIAVLLSLFLVSYYYLRNKFASLFIPSMLILIGVTISIKNFLYYI